MASINPRLDKVLSRFSSRDVHRYKSYIKGYLQWCNEHGEGNNVWGNVRRFHWFIQEQWREKKIGSVSELKSLVNCFRLAVKEMVGEEGGEREYLDNVLRLYERESLLQSSGGSVVQFEKICLNLWNTETPSLNDKYFKTCQDKVKWLLDYQLNYYTNAGLDDRKTWMFKDFDVVSDSVLVIRNQWAVVAQEKALLCPLFTLAVYLHLRFYGVKKQYRGDGFPDLSDDMRWGHLPIIRGKSLTKFPRVETLGNYYPAVFQYCQLPYKKRLYFQTRVDEPVFPDALICEAVPRAEESGYFVNNIGRDFILGMNRYLLSVELPSVDVSDDPLLYELFPDVEKYDNRSSAAPFLRVMALLRKVLFRSLPVLYEYFPNHDIFQDPLFHLPQFVAYLNAKDSVDTSPTLPLYHLVENGKAVGLGEQGNTPTPSLESNPPQQEHINSQIDAVPYHADLRKDTLQFVKDQSLANFTILIKLLSSLFDKIETRRSNKQMIQSELQSLQNTLKRKISSMDSIPVISANDCEDEDGEHPPKRPRNAMAPLLDNDNTSGDDVSDDEAEDMEELQTLVQQLVHRHVTNATETTLERLRGEIRNIVREELTLRGSISPPPTLPPSGTADSARPPELLKEHSTSDTTPDKFVLQPDLDSIRDIVLEWFTPNAKFNDECVHSMNKKYGRAWRTSSCQEALYKSRKMIIELYIHLVNDRGVSRQDAIDECERVRDSRPIPSFSKWLKTYKRNHGGFLGITNNE